MAKRPKSRRRQRGEDSIYQRADGRWTCQIFLGTRPDGKPDRRYLYGDSPEEVIEKQRKFHEQAAAGFVPTKGRGQTVGEWMSHWLHHIAKAEIRENTWNRSYRSKVEGHIIPGLGRLRMKSLAEQGAEQRIEEFYARLRDEAGLAPASILQIHRILSRALKVATMRGLIPRNPCQFITPPALDQVEVLPPEREEATAILETVAGRRNGARWALGLAAGPRQGEALGLMWSHLDLDDLDHASVRIAWELVRLPWKHGCDDPHSCGAKRHRLPCPPDPADCAKAQRTSGRRHICKRPCPPRCREHDKCPTFCGSDCAAHAASCPQRQGGGLVLTEPKSKKSRRTVSIPREVARLLVTHRTAQKAERLAHPRWVGWGHDKDACDRRPRARESVCPKCRLPVKPDALVFAQSSGRPIDPRRDWQEWTDLLEELGLPHYRPHDGRHFTATTALEAGVDVVVVQEMLGHATPGFTQEVYQHVTPRLQKDAAQRIGGALWADSLSDSVRAADPRGSTRKRTGSTRD
ncbi:tyrosine-type recombinase/integrase [Streptosporangium sp. NPDC000239]|uniref:tyrosine-type recombinase/integrase n=1 Tax=Streptosporangium sp. NPDC000239 TaxID=3154248 RepID=UPI0033221E9C